MATRAAATRPSSSSGRPRVVVVGAGFAGFQCARALDRKFAGQLEIVLVDPADHTLYLPLVPEVAGGVLDPRQAAIPLAASLRSTRVLTSTVTAIDPGEHTFRVRGADGREQELGWQRLVLNPGSVTRTFGIAGVDEHAQGFNTLAEALYLRERILGQLELAAIAPNGSTREGHGSFVVVGGGFTGLALASNGLRLARTALLQHPGMDPKVVRWTVVFGEVLPIRSGRRIEPFSWRRAGRGGATVRHRHRYDRRTRAGDNPFRLPRAVHHGQCTFQWLERSMPGAGVPAPGLLRSLNGECVTGRTPSRLHRGRGIVGAAW
jgi:hypothetical protein